MNDEWKIIGRGQVEMPAGAVPHEVMLNCSGDAEHLFGLAKGIDHRQGGAVSADRIEDPIYHKHLEICGCLWIPDAIKTAKTEGVEVTADYILQYMENLTQETK